MIIISIIIIIVIILLGMRQGTIIIVIPVIVGAPGIVHRSVEGWLEEIGIKENFTVLQKTCLLGTARTLRHVLNS